MAKQQTETATVVQIPAPDIKIIERGQQHVFGLPSENIKLKDPQMVTRWVNTAIGGNQLGKHLDAGYLKTRPEYLADPDRVSFTVSPEGYVVTGNRGEELLMYTTIKNAQSRAAKKAAINQARMRSSAMKSEVAEAAANTLGPEAADYLNRKGSVIGGVRDSHERIERRDEQE